MLTLKLTQPSCKSINQAGSGAEILMLCYFNSCSQQSVEDVAPATGVFVLE